MIIRLHDKLECELPVSIKKYKSIQVISAIIPTTYFNVNRKLENDYLQFELADESTGLYLNKDSINLPDGLYSPASYNKEIQKALSKKGYPDKFNLTYNANNGKITIKLVSPFVVYLHPKLCDMLGVTFHNTFLLNSITGDKPCEFLPHHEYRICCNLVDENKNFFNGKQSKIIESFVPKGKQYGDINEYFSKKTSRN